MLKEVKGGSDGRKEGGSEETKCRQGGKYRMGSTGSKSRKVLKS
jgi:hypothetical protein